MKEIVRVNIASIPFALEADAYAQLNGYLERLERHYKSDADRQEIVADIEARIAELILSEQSVETSVSNVTIGMIIKRLGEPTDEVGAEQCVDNEPQLPKRLYRKREGRRLGGVCSGLAAYFDTDPVWFRLGIFAPLILCIFAAPLRSELSESLGAIFGGLVVAYLLLWLVVPTAKTSRQKLEMYGHKITVNSIERGVRDSFSGDRRVSNMAGFLAELLGVTLRIALFCIKLVAIAIGLLLALIAVVILICFVAALVGFARFADIYAIDMLPLNEISFSIYLGIVLLCLLLPVLALGLLLVSALFRRAPARKGISIMVGIWIILLTFTTVISLRNFDVLKSNIEALKHIDRSVTISEEIRFESDSTYSCPIIINSITQEDGSDK